MKINPNYTLFNLDITTQDLDINLIKEYFILNLIPNKDLYYLVENFKYDYDEHIDFYKAIIGTLILDTKYAFDLIYNKYLTKYDSPFFEKALDACSKNNKYTFELIDKKIVEHTDNPKFLENGIRKIYLKSPKKIYSALYKNVINKYHSYKIYLEAIERCIKDPYYCMELLNHKMIEKNTSFYLSAIDKCLEYTQYSYELIEKKVILDEGKDVIFFKKAIQNCSENSHYSLKLIKNNLLKIDSNHWVKIMENLVQHFPCCRKLLEQRLIPQDHKYWSKAYNVFKFYYPNDALNFDTDIDS